MKDMDFSSKLIETRKAKGLTQEEVAEECNLNVRTIQRIESGEVQPRAHTIRVISTALKIDLQEQKKSENRSFIWHIKDLFNFKTHKMRKLTILSSTVLLLVLSLFLIGSPVQAQTQESAPDSGITIQYNDDQTLQRIDVVFTHELTLDKLMKISEALAKHNIQVTYRDLSFDEKGHLTSISCKVSKDGGKPSGSFSAKDLATTKNKQHFGFYYDYSKGTNKMFCTGACW
jgi:transcriptional regulator with XRE-family HTH domain